LSFVPPFVRAAVSVAVILASLVGVIGPGRPALGQGEPGATAPAADEPPPPPPPVPDPRISPLLAAVPVDSAAYRAAVNRYREAEERLAAARTTFADAEAMLGTLTDANARLVGQGNEAGRKLRKAEARLVQLRAGVREFAVASYIAGGIGDPVSPSLDLDEINERTRQRVLADTVSEQQLAELAATADQQQRMEAVLNQVEADLEDVRRRLDETTRVRDGAISDGARATADLATRAQEVADARLVADVVGLDFTFVVFDAYVKGALTMATERPDCALRWSALAGIGRTESGHGIFGGARVQANGDLTQRIIGIPLDGSNGTAVIADSDGGALDGDTDFDRAVGPMQFIPTSWRTLGRDGNADGAADPQNMYDAALAAAQLLCRGRTLDTDAGLRAGFLGYNNSQAYASMVLDRTHAYDLYVIPPVP
jgi:membrane-bound lytic murein transglycosylase B